ncbi:MAG: primosomal protein N' [Deltaproteobacteria bacterium]|nr:primosomal protein N' [Deltaproteobacteria bacterium]
MNSFTIAVTRPVRETYSYSIPESLLPRVKVGSRVLVPFRNQKVIGYVLDITRADTEMELRDIIDILDSEPLFHQGQVRFFQWMADYYFYPIGCLIQSALPSGLNAMPFKTGRITSKGLSALNSGPITNEERNLLKWIENNPGKRLRSPLHRFYLMENRGWIDIEERRGRKTATSLTRKFVRSCVPGAMDESLKKKAVSSRARNEKEFLETVSANEHIPLNELRSRFSNCDYLVKKWLKAGLIEKFDMNIARDYSSETLLFSPDMPELTKQQKEVVNLLGRLLDKGSFDVCLLHGVTGSGKTEVYLRAVMRAFENGKQAILMVPEIALASYMEGIFRARLKDRYAIFHSGLSDGERYEKWIKAYRGETDLVIGARSALFAPLPDLGLIIVDEEYDYSFKQEENPRYQARDAAVFRARIENAVILLGAGTPSIQSYHNSSTGRYRLLSMPERIEKRPLPEMHIVDMKKVSESSKKENIISPPLEEAIRDTLEKKKQTMLFLNRRGFSRVYLCRACGVPVKCRNCDLTLTLHLKKNRLSCHYCGFSIAPPSVCEKCGHGDMRAFGFGTERLETLLKTRFPDARIARMDRDSTQRKGQTYDILRNFSKGDIDILVGTQMITKGYDFPNVTLVGVIAADLSLDFPDFRAGERTFQLISQVAGRAGRGDMKGRVIIQTFNPDHYAITAALSNDYTAFFLKERDLRELLEYPPFSYLACLRFMGNSSRDTSMMAQRVGREMKAMIDGWPQKGKKINILGPVESPLSRLKGKYRWQILIKSKGTELLHYYLREVEKLSVKSLKKSGVTMVIDVDPYQML